MHRLHLFPDLILLFTSLLLQILVTGLVWKSSAVKTRPRAFALIAGNLLASAASLIGYLLSFHRTWRYLPAVTATWLQASGMALTVVLAGFAMGLLVWRKMPAYPSPRRRFLKSVGAALAVTPLAVTTFGIIVRNHFQLNEVSIRVPNLPVDLQGLRLVQITDIHLSPFLTAKEFARAIDMANETKPHIVLVTGDLITRQGDPLDACIAELARLRGEAGALGCLGNHEVYTDTEDYVTAQGKRIGIDFLRHEARSLKFGTARINFVGVDYQQFRSPYLVGAEALVVPGQLNVMLSHNPDVFETAVRKGFDVTISGHTHGGQVNVELLHHNWNVAQTFTPYVRGLYERGKSSIYVSSGIGTIGVPVRVGAPPEVSLIKLCAS